MLRVSPDDPGTLEDPIAEKTSWRPRAPGAGQNYDSHQFCEDVSRPGPPSATASYRGRPAQQAAPRAVFRQRSGGKIGRRIMTIIGSVFLVAGAVVAFTASVEAEWERIVALLFFGVIGSLFFLPGLLSRAGRDEPAFDKRSRAFTKADKSCPLDQIHAVQLVWKRVRCGHDPKRKYRSYEINLVLKDGSRLYVVDYGTGVGVRKNAAKLGEFLDVPVWDAT